VLPKQKYAERRSSGEAKIDGISSLSDAYSYKSHGDKLKTLDTNYEDQKAQKQWTMMYVLGSRIMRGR
jgi:hypothetical protein